MNLLESLKKYSVIVADTGDIEAIARLRPQAEAARARLAEVTAVMSLLEGHADVVMDEVGPQIIPSVAHIRSKFNERRKGVGAFDRMLRRLLGLEAKMRQYRDGAVFVRSVVDQVGMDGFNRVWESPETLPKPTEIETPSLSRAASRICCAVMAAISAPAAT